MNGAGRGAENERGGGASRRVKVEILGLQREIAGDCGDGQASTGVAQAQEGYGGAVRPDMAHDFEVRRETLRLKGAPGAGEQNEKQIEKRNEEQTEGQIGEQMGEQTRLCAEGACGFRGGVCYIFYDEADAEGQTTRTRVKVYPDWFEVVKKGAGASRLVFREGERWETEYATPYGRLELALQVESVRTWIRAGNTLQAGSVWTLTRAEETPQEGSAPQAESVAQAEASYVLELNGVPTSRCTVRITAWACL